MGRKRHETYCLCVSVAGWLAGARMEIMNFQQRQGITQSFNCLSIYFHTQNRRYYYL